MRRFAWVLSLWLGCMVAGFLAGCAETSGESGLNRSQADQHERHDTGIESHVRDL